MSKNIKIDIKEVTRADGSEIVVFETGEKTRICMTKSMFTADKEKALLAIGSLLEITAIYNDDVFLVDDTELDTEVENENGNVG